MANIPELKGAIFDLDDTLLDNSTDDGFNLHDHSCVAAAHAIGKQHGIPALQTFTLAQRSEAFATARAHTLQAAMWRLLYMAGQVTAEEVEPEHPLLVQLIDLKNELHEDILRTKGRGIPHATEFVANLAAHGLQGNLAISTTAVRRDVDVFLEMTDLTQYFADEKIISIERLTHPKPHPQAFDLAFQSLGLPDSTRPHVAAFEDHPRGIMSAKAAGLFTCAITTRFTRQELAALDIIPDLIADSFAEFGQLLGLTPHKAPTS